MHVSRAVFITECLSSSETLIESITNLPDGNVGSSEHSHTVDFNSGGIYWHEDSSLNFKLIARKCDSLGVISSTGADYSVNSLLGR